MISHIVKEFCQEHDLPHFFEDEVESTNTLAKTKSLASEKPHNSFDHSEQPQKKPTTSAKTPTSSQANILNRDQKDQQKNLSVFSTNFQTQGRGRGNNQWNSEKNQGLLISFLFSLQKPPQHITAPKVGLCLFQAVQKTWPTLAWSLKAPNDLYLQTKKVGGLLLESSQQLKTDSPQFDLIVGLGFNIFGHPLAIENATHLNSAEGLNEKTTDPSIHQSIKKFLSLFVQELIQAQSVIIDQNLPPEDCQALLQALNAHPLLTSPFVQVKPNGDLVTNKTTTSWRNL